jgi:sulfoxide reductase catalytic subunit YedY
VDQLKGPRDSRGGGDDIPSPVVDEVTPPEIYFNRRRLLRGGVLLASGLATAALYRRLNGMSSMVTETARLGEVAAASSAIVAATRLGPGEGITSLAEITHYNNFYEFTTDKDGVADVAASFDTAGWRVSVEGLVKRPRVFSLDDLRQLGAVEERVYRMRCVEAWSMVIPWAGLPLAALLDSVEPLAGARYVAFESLHDPRRMPGQSTDVLEWPYVEGLRLDEAMHPLTLLATGIYGRALPPQDGAPIRLVVPWKYGFKGIKSIVKIALVAEQPANTWNRQAPGEYGFYANVNPHVDHPRWSQATERRIGESARRATLMFNGYAEQVAHLYAGLDLHANY